MTANLRHSRKEHIQFNGRKEKPRTKNKKKEEEKPENLFLYIPSASPAPKSPEPKPSDPQPVGNPAPPKPKAHKQRRDTKKFANPQKGKSGDIFVNKQEEISKKISKPPISIQDIMPTQIPELREQFKLLINLVKQLYRKLNQQ
jgi:hypothetical protein